MSEHLKAPWTDEQVAALVKRQETRWVHPYTCDGDSNCPSRELIPTNNGWVCACGKYTQDWCHKADTEGWFENIPTELKKVFDDNDTK